MYLIKQGGRVDYNYKKYILDTASELNQIPKNDCCPGSIAYVIETKTVYMLNCQKQWVEHEAGAFSVEFDSINDTLVFHRVGSN